MQYKSISVDISDNICVLTLNRPEKLNILSQIFFDDFELFIEQIRKNDDVKALVIHGNEKVFSAGGDLKEIQEADRDKIKLMSMRVQKSFLSLLSLDIPVIAALSGIVYGGGLELALHCDIRICSENAELRLPEADIGLIPGAGGVSLFARHFTHGDAAYYLMTGEQIPLKSALEKGLIQKIYDNKEYLSESMKLAKLFTTKSKFSLSAIKRILVAGYFNFTDECLNREVEEFASTLNHDGRNKISEFFKNK